MNTERPSRNQKLGDSSRLRGKGRAQSTTKTRRREESRRLFDQWKNSFQLAKDFRLRSMDLCSSVFICGFILCSGGAYLESRVSYYPEIGRLDFTPGRDSTEFG